MTDNSKHWITAFNKCNFPILKKSREKLDALRENEDDIKINDLLEIARLDPGIALTLLRYAGTRQKKEITTLSHAILLISIPQTLKILSGLTVLEEKYPADIALFIKQLYTQHYLIAYLSMDWAIYRKESETNELFTAGLNHDFFILIVSLIEYEKAKALLKIRDKDKNRKEREIELLGSDINFLSEKVAKSWRLPELICESYSEHHHNPKITGIRLASDLVEWIYTKQSILYPESILGQVAEYLHVPLHKAPSIINKSIVSVLRHTYQRLPEKRLVRIFMSLSVLKNQTLNFEQDKKQTLSDFVQQLTTTKTKKNTGQLIHLSTKALYEGAGIPRVLFFAFNKNANILNLFSQKVNKQSTELKHLSISLELNRLFSQLMKKEQTLIINTRNKHKYIDFLPSILKPTNPKTTIIINSIYVNNKKLGCLFIDFEENEKELSNQHIKSYKIICKALKAAIESNLSKKNSIKKVA